MSGFNNSILGGNGALVRPAINSGASYAPGASGWTINRDGSAEFNNVTIRGTSIIGPASGQRIVIDSGAGTITMYDANGAITGVWSAANQRFHLQNAVSSAWMDLFVQNNVPTIILTAPGFAFPGQVDVVNEGATARLDLTSPAQSGGGTNATLILRSSGGGAKADALLITDYTAGTGSPVRFDGPWNTLPLNAFNNGFQAAGTLANGTDPAWRYVASNRIELRGQWQPSPGGPITTGAVPITLPAGLWPLAGSGYFASATSITASTVTGRTRIGTAGAIQFNFVGATPPTWASLDGIAFDLS